MPKVELAGLGKATLGEGDADEDDRGTGEEVPGRGFAQDNDAQDHGDDRDQVGDGGGGGGALVFIRR